MGPEGLPTVYFCGPLPPAAGSLSDHGCLRVHVCETPALLPRRAFVICGLGALAAVLETGPEKVILADEPRKWWGIACDETLVDCCRGDDADELLWRIRLHSPAAMFRFSWGVVSIGADIRINGILFESSEPQARIFCALVRAGGDVVPIRVLGMLCRGQSPSSRAVSVHVAHLRKHLRQMAISAENPVLTSRGKGYRIKA